MSRHSLPGAVRQPVARSGPTLECRLHLPNAFEHGCFRLVPWLHQAVVRLGSPLPPPRLISVGSITNAVAGNRAQQLLVDGPAERGIIFTPEGDRRLERFERLCGSLEAD